MYMRAGARNPMAMMSFLKGLGDQHEFNPPAGSVRLPASDKFVDRPSDTAVLEGCLVPQPGSRQTRRRVFVLYGLGGIGKTQLAAGFARRHQATFNSVFWLDGRSEDQLRQSLASYANRIPKGQIPDRSRNLVLNSEDHLNIVEANLLDWLARPDNVNWLLVFDNVYQDYEQEGATGAYDVRRYLPGDHGSVLITTRLSRLAQLGEWKQLKKVDEELGLAIFKQWRGAELVMNEAGRELLALLDGLPLALAQAAAYLREHEGGLDIRSYLRLYKQQWDNLMMPSGSPLVGYERNVGTTWAISFQAVEARSKNAANLLRLWAFVDNRDLWRGLLQTAADGGEQWPGWLREMACNEVRFLDAAGLLLRYSIVEASMQGSYLIHPVVHRWTSHIQNAVEKREFLRLAVKVVGFSAPKETAKEYWILQRRLLPHAERCIWWMLKEAEFFGGTEWRFDGGFVTSAIYGLGNLYDGQGKLKEAEEMYLRALEGKEKELGRDHLSTLDTVNNLGNLYHKQGNLEKAKELHLRALEGRETELGPDHPSTLQTVHNLGNLYADQDKLKEAEKMYLRALEGKEKDLGRDHLSTLDTSTVNKASRRKPRSSICGRRSMSFGWLN